MFPFFVNWNELCVAITVIVCVTIYYLTENNENGRKKPYVLVEKQRDEAPSPKTGGLPVRILYGTQTGKAKGNSSTCPYFYLLKLTLQSLQKLVQEMHLQ